MSAVMFDNLFFLHPAWLISLALVLLIVFALWSTGKLSFARQFAVQSEQQNTVFHPQINHIRTIVYQVINRRQHRSWRKLFFVSTIACLSFLSLSQPYLRGKQLPLPQQYRDILFIVDTEVSMLLRDYIVDGERVDRMTMVKSVLNHMVDQLQGNRMGVILYSEHADTLVPLTQDYSLLKTMIKRVEVGVTGRMSDPGSALVHSAGRLLGNDHRTPGLDKNSENEYDLPILVLLSGVDRPVPNISPVAAAEYLKELGFTLHTIAIGASSPDAEETDVSTLIYQPANFPLLKKMAEAANGRFYWAKNAEALSDAIITIQQAEKRSSSQQAQFVRIPLYQWPILLILVLLLWQQTRRYRNE